MPLRTHRGAAVKNSRKGRVPGGDGGSSGTRGPLVGTRNGPSHKPLGNEASTRSSKPASGYIPKRTEGRVPKGCAPHARSGIVHRSPEAGAAQGPPRDDGHTPAAHPQRTILRPPKGSEFGPSLLHGSTSETRAVSQTRRADAVRAAPGAGGVGSRRQEVEEGGEGGQRLAGSLVSWEEEEVLEMVAAQSRDQACSREPHASELRGGECYVLCVLPELNILRTSVSSELPFTENQKGESNRKRTCVCSLLRGPQEGRTADQRG